MKKDGGKATVWERNFAEDPELAEKVAGHFTPRVRIVRSNRYPLDEAMWRFFNMWNVTKDGYHGYAGRAQLYIPEVRKNVEAQARQLTKSAFPTDDCFDVNPSQTGTESGAEAWRSMMKFAMDQASLTQKYFVAMRQLCLYGTCPIYLPWRKEVRHEFRSRRGDKGKIGPVRSEVELFNGPDFVPRDIFRWYPFNEKRSDLRDGCFDISAVNKFELLKRAREGLVANVDQILEGTGNAYANEEFSRDVMRAQSEGLNLPFSTGSMGEAYIGKDDGKGNHTDTTYMCNTIYSDMVFPEACEEGEDPEKPIPMMIEIWGNQFCGLIQRNPFYHQKPPYVVGKYIQPNPDEFYGQGIPWAIQFMQYEMNVKAEQGMDSATMSLNPIAIIDPGMAGASNEFNIEPGAIWWANPTGVKLTQMPDATPIAYQAISQLKGLMGDYSDRSPALPPELLGKSRTATQSEIVSDSLSVDNWLFQMQNEQLILTPLLQQWESLIDQHMGEEQLIQVLGRETQALKRTVMTRGDLLGRYAYTWKGASSVSGKQILARQMLDAMKTWFSAPPGSTNGVQFNFGELFKILWKDIWLLPNAERILGTPEQGPSSDADSENKMVDMGLEVEVLPNDDDKTHMQSHDAHLPKIKNKARQAVMMAHILEHKKQDDQKTQVAQQQAQQQQMQQQMQVLNMQALAAKGQIKNNTHPPQGQGSGNRSQMSPNAGTADIASGNRG